MNIKQLLLLILVTCSVHAFGQTTPLTAVFFNSNQSELPTQEKEKIKQFIQNTAVETISEIRLIGYCDDMGTARYNDLLSQKRADEVKALFIALGVSEALISQSIGKGEVAISSSEEDIARERKLNRRVDIEMVYHITEEPPIKKVAQDSSIIKTDVKVGDKITLKNILFVGGHDELLPESYDELEKLASILRAKKQYHILVLGHVCCVYDGGDGEDLETGLFNLSVVRAKTIYTYLVRNGVEAERLSYKGLKAEYPTGKGDKFDRRVEIQITKIEGQ